MRKPASASAARPSRTVAVLGLLLLASTLATPSRAQDAPPRASPLASPLASPGAATPLPTSPPPDPAAGDFGPVQADAPYRLVLLVPYPDAAYWQAVAIAAQNRAAQDGVTLEVVPLTAPSAPEQVAQLEAVVQSEVEGILLGPIDPVGVIPGLDVAAASGIPVIAVSAEPPAGSVVGTVIGDDEAAAYAAGAYIADTLGGRGLVLDLQGNIANPAGESRERGLRAALARSAEIDVDAQPIDQLTAEPAGPRGQYHAR